MGRRKRQRLRDELASEPAYDPADLAYCGDELIFVADYTPNGVPLGVPIAQMRRDDEREARGAGWARAKHILRTLLELELGAVLDVGRVTKIGHGMSRDIFAAEVDLRDHRPDSFVVALPREDAEPSLDDRTRRELRVVSWLRRRALPFRLPDMVGAFPDGERLALVRRFVRGTELDLLAGRQPSIRPCAMVGEMAAAIHAVTVAEVASLVPGSSTRREHALEAIAVFDDLSCSELRDARAWAMQHLPTDEPSTLLHGDLLGQNILLAVDGPPHVIDWEHARRGDPAYDLAIVTRGVKRPFGMDCGLDRLLDDYHACGGHPAVRKPDVQLYELCMNVKWYRDALARRGHRSAASELGLVRNLLRRLG